MGKKRHARIAFTLVILSVITAGVGAVPLETATSATGTTLVVGDQAEYQRIQPAIDAAADGDTIEVHPGTYTQAITVDKDVRIVAPQGASLAPSSSENADVGLTISVGTAAEPIIDGFSITGYEHAISANGTAGAWTVQNTVVSRTDGDGIKAERTSGAWMLRNVTITQTGDDGIDASRSSGKWEIIDSLIEDNQDGINAENTTARWSVKNTTIRGHTNDGIDADGVRSSNGFLISNTTIVDNYNDGIDADKTPGAWMIKNTTLNGNFIGVSALETSGNWVIRNSTIRRNANAGVGAALSEGTWSIQSSILINNGLTDIYAMESTGSWTLRESTLQETASGILATRSTGNWTVVGSNIESAYIPDESPLSGGSANYGGTGIVSLNTSGSWSVTNSRFGENPQHAVNATGAARQGNVSGNWWGSRSNPDSASCVGNVRCTDPLSTSPISERLIADVSESESNRAIQRATEIYDARRGTSSEYIRLILLALLSVVAILSLVSARKITAKSVR